MPPRQPPERSSREPLQLLLVRADDHRPLLPGGLAGDSVWNAPRPERMPRRAEVPSLERVDVDPNLLPAQRWGVVAPEGGEGDALLAAVAPLLELRAREQGAGVRVYRVPPGLDVARAVEWRDRVYRDEAVPQEERPRYLLLLGDLHQVSIELQQVLAHGAFVGRLCSSTPAGSPDLAGYAAYVEKVLACERPAEAPELPEVLLYTAPDPDGSDATEQGRRLLVEPCRKVVEAQWLPSRLAGRLQALGAEAEPEALLRAAGAARAGVMLSVSHGLGMPAGGWASVEQQRTFQGALYLGPGRLLTAGALRTGPFLRGGAWCCVACFGAATPSKSAFYAWLSLLARNQLFRGRPEDVLESLPRPGERPFVAALPQAALANPEGPLAVFGHSDLAWSFGFTDPANLGESRASRILGALKVLARGSRAGVALDALMRSYRDVNDSLMSEYQERQDALTEGRPDPTDPRRLGHLWMLRNDLRGYLLLGDPAVRLPLLRAAG